MVIQEDSSMPSDSKALKQKMESKKYILVKNHVREVIEKDSESHNSVEKTEKASKIKKNERQQSSSSDDNLNTTEISKSDLDELKTVYKKCKAVLMSIESKYGHLLNLDDDSHFSRKRKSISSDEQCECTANKRIVFNDDGQHVYEDGSIRLQNHICHKKLKHHNIHVGNYESLEIEHENLLMNLPETIQELTELLKDPSIKGSLRRTIIERIKNIRHENLNMLRFDRETLIEQLKSNPDDIMGFKGTNISSLTGYPTLPTK